MTAVLHELWEMYQNKATCVCFPVFPGNQSHLLRETLMPQSSSPHFTLNISRVCLGDTRLLMALPRGPVAFQSVPKYPFLCLAAAGALLH